MTKNALIFAVGFVALLGCAAPAPPPVPLPDTNCAVPTEEEKTDGGYGGTGNAPEDCPPAQ